MVDYYENQIKKYRVNCEYEKVIKFGEQYINYFPFSQQLLQEIALGYYYISNKIEEILLEYPEVEYVLNATGYSMLSGSNIPNSGFMFVSLVDWFSGWLAGCCSTAPPKRTRGSLLPNVSMCWGGRSRNR
jgi:hypothetical protein